MTSSRRSDPQTWQRFSLPVEISWFGASIILMGLKATAGQDAISPEADLVLEYEAISAADKQPTNYCKRAS